MTYEKMDSNLIERIAGDIPIASFFYLVEITSNSVASGLYEISGNTFEYHSSTVDIFRKYCDEIKSTYGVKGILLIYKKMEKLALKNFLFTIKSLEAEKFLI